jgi:GNAT superfamily N-acetyltransferase
VRPDIAVFDVATATEDELTGYYELRRDVLLTDQPADPAPTYDAVVGRLRVPLQGWGDCRYWVARLDGRMVGSATVGFPAPVNRHQGRTEIVVHPDLRRRGIGTALLRAVLPALRDDARSVVEGWTVKDTPGADWASGLGFREVRETALQCLVLADAGSDTLAVDPPPGYRLHRWPDRIPDGVLASYAAVRSAIADAPRGEASDQAARWSPQRVRAAEQDLRRAQVEHRVVAAVDEASGTVAAMTELDVYPHRPEFGYQGDTVVLAEHRGRRLGYCVKAGMLRWLLAERPGLERIYTSSAATNEHMLRVNREIGFAVFRRALEFEQDVDEVAATVARR